MYIGSSCVWFFIGGCLFFGQGELLMGSLLFSSLYKVKSLILCILVADVIRL